MSDEQKTQERFELWAIAGGDPQMCPDVAGRWVKHDDVAPLLATIEQQAKRIEELEKRFNDVADELDEKLDDFRCSRCDNDSCNFTHHNGVCTAHCHQCSHAMIWNPPKVDRSVLG